jgi:hypothetical protein
MCEPPPPIGRPENLRATLTGAPRDRAQLSQLIRVGSARDPSRFPLTPARYLRHFAVARIRNYNVATTR